MPESAQEAVLSDAKAYHWRAGPEGKTDLDRLANLIASPNIAEDLSDDELNRLGEKVRREFEVDKSSRSDWEETNTEALKLARQVVEQKNYPWPKASNIKYPLLTVAAVQFAARAYPAIISGPDVVKARVRGKDDGIPLQQALMGGTAPLAPPQQGPQGGPIGTEGLGGPVPFMPPGDMAPQQGPQAQQQPPEQQWEVEPGAKKARADRVARHMSYQLLDEMEEWEEDTDKLLHVVPIIGCAFRKTWFDPGLGRNRSELVMADDMVVNTNAKSLATVPRVTQIIRLYPYEIEERERDGLFREIDLPKATPQDSNDDDAPHEFLEQHRAEDLDGDGYPEPYIVTSHKESGKVVRIVARFDETSISFAPDGRVSRIEATEFYTKYGFIPAFDGTFYDLGFGTLLRPLSEAINTSINQMLDAGHLQNTGGGFIGAGLRIKGGAQRFRPGEFKRVISTGGSIKDNVVPMPFPGPSSTLFQLLGLLIEAARDITSVKDVMTGDAGPTNEAASRTMARIEQGMKVFGSIYKRLYRSLKKEYRKLFRLNGLYLDEDTYFTLLDDPEAIGPQDYNAEDMDISPVADPNMVTEVQRLAHAEFLGTFMDDPYIDPLEARRRILAAAGMPDIDDLLVEEPPPDPEMARMADEIEVKKREVEIKAQQLELDKPKVEAEARKLMAQAAESQSKTILNLANAEAVSDKVEIEALKLMSNEACEQLRYRLEAGKAMDVREANEQKAKIDEGRVSGVAGKSGNGSGQSVSA